jgi:hypothetical protein
MEAHGSERITCENAVEKHGMEVGRADHFPVQHDRQYASATRPAVR